MDDVPRQRRPRYPGRNPRRFDEKYKERDPARFPETVAKVVASGKTPAGSHRPILVDEVLAALRPEPGLVAVDATLGHGGHAAALLPLLLPGGRLVGLDADPLELPRAAARLRALGFGAEAMTVRRSSFAGLPKVLRELGLDSVDLFLADLGVSSMQLDRAERGFSFMKDGPLDMRMGRSGPTAADLVAELPAEELARVFREYGEEPRARAVARGLVEARKEAPIRTTGELRRLVTKAVGPRREEGKDPATRVFQALRIATNRELVELERFLDDAISRLSLGARLAVLSYHSLEDRIVKDVFRDRSAGCSCPPSFPVCVCSRRRVLALVTRKPVRPSDEELHENRRSRSARMRVAERVASDPPRSG